MVKVQLLERHDRNMQEERLDLDMILLVFA